MEQTTKQIGDKGEQLAFEMLKRQGFHILARNWRKGSYELDIVAFKQGVIHVVEVKTRKFNSLTSPEEAMTEAKFAALCKGARLFLSCNNMNYQLQFDLVAVEMGDGDYNIRYIPNVMSPRW